MDVRSTSRRVETFGNIGYVFDSDGYLKLKNSAEGDTTYSYARTGELLEVVKPDSTIISYTNDPMGRRVAKSINGEIVEKYLWLDRTTLLAIFDKDDNLISRFNYADSRVPYSMEMNNQTYYLTYDQVGSLRAVSDSSGNIVKEISYDSFGNIISDTNENFKVPFGFAGGLQDTDTNLVRFGYRDYDPNIGKWTARDPILFNGGDSNLYGYVLNDPINLIDPSGLILNIISELLSPTDLGAGSDKPIWTSTKKKSSVKNAYDHWKKHKNEFPELNNALEYVKKADDFLNNPDNQTLTRTRDNGDKLFYNEKDNNFGVKNKNGIPKTFFRPKDGIKYFCK